MVLKDGKHFMETYISPIYNIHTKSFTRETTTHLLLYTIDDREFLYTTYITRPDFIHNKQKFIICKAFWYSIKEQKIVRQYDYCTIPFAEDYLLGLSIKKLLWRHIEVIYISNFKKYVDEVMENFRFGIYTNLSKEWKYYKKNHSAMLIMSEYIKYWKEKENVDEVRKYMNSLI